MITFRQAQERFWPTEIQKAEARWRQRNAEAKLRGCPCGEPATEVRYNHGTVGSVPHEMWTCIKHVDVISWYKLGGGAAVPLWGDERDNDKPVRPGKREKL